MTLKATTKLAKAYQLNLGGGADEAVPEKKKRTKEEAMHQAALIRHRNTMKEKYPNLRYLFATLNGIFMPPHIRAQAIEAGLEKGILDLWYMIRRIEIDGSVYSGLVMDLKKLKDGRPTPDQLRWAAHLVEQGFLVGFPSGCVEAWRMICCFEGIAAEDHIAPDLIAAENQIRRMCEVEGASEWEP